MDENYGTPAFPLLAMRKDGDVAMRLLPGMTPPRFLYGDGLHLPSPPPGRMIATCIVTLDGVPTNCCIDKGLPGYNRALLRVLRSWRYEPGIFEGKPVSVIFDIEVDMKAGEAKKFQIRLSDGTSARSNSSIAGLFAASFDMMGTHARAPSRNGPSATPR